MRNTGVILVGILTVAAIIAAVVLGVSLFSGSKDTAELTIENPSNAAAEGNEKAVSVDPFDGLEVTFSGISPDAVMDNIDRTTKEGAWVTYTCEPAAGLVIGQNVTVKAALKDTDKYRLTTSEQVYTVENVDAYITDLSFVTGDVIKKMRDRAEADFTNNTASAWPGGTKLARLGYCGMYFLTAKDPAAQDQNKATLVYKVDVEAEKDVSYYTYTTFYDLIKRKDGNIEVDLSRSDSPRVGAAGSGQFSAAGITFAGYRDPAELKKKCVTDQSASYRCESSVTDLKVLGGGPEEDPEEESDTEAPETEETESWNFDEWETETWVIEPDETEELTWDETEEELTWDETGEELTWDETEEELTWDETEEELTWDETEELKPATKSPETTAPAPAPTTQAPETPAPTPAPTTQAPETTIPAPEPTTPEPEPETEPETPEPETFEPETLPPETEEELTWDETEAPETEAPETEAPETEAPETEAPETEAPEPAADYGDIDAGYAQTLTEYAGVLAGGDDAEFRGLSADGGFGDEFAYALYDLNGDGSDELIITDRLLTEDGSEGVDLETGDANVIPDRIHILTAAMPDSGEEDDELADQAHEFLCDTDDEHHIILEDDTIALVMPGEEEAAGYFRMDADGGMAISDEDPEYLGSLGRKVFSSSLWSYVLPRG